MVVGCERTRKITWKLMLCFLPDGKIIAVTKFLHTMPPRQALSNRCEPQPSSGIGLGWLNRASISARGDNLSEYRFFPGNLRSWRVSGCCPSLINFFWSVIKKVSCCQLARLLSYQNFIVKFPGKASDANCQCGLRMLVWYGTKRGWGQKDSIMTDVYYELLLIFHLIRYLVDSGRYHGWYKVMK